MDIEQAAIIVIKRIFDFNTTQNVIPIIGSAWKNCEDFYPKDLDQLQIEALDFYQIKCLQI